MNRAFGSPGSAQNFANRLAQSDGYGERAKKRADINPQQNKGNFPTPVWIRTVKIKQISRKAKHPEQFFMEEGKNQDRGNCSEIGQNRIFEPLSDIKSLPGRAKTAQKGADVGILAEFKNRNRAENQG